MSEKFNKYVLALDLVEDGSETEIKDIKKNQLPPSITSKMLYADIVKIAWPSVVELTLTQLASMVDLMMVGGLGAWACLLYTSISTFS